MQQRIAPSVAIEAAIEAALAGGLGDPDALSTLGRLGAQLVLQRAVARETLSSMQVVQPSRELITRFEELVEPAMVRLLAISPDPPKPAARPADEARTGPCAPSTASHAPGPWPVAVG